MSACNWDVSMLETADEISRIEVKTEATNTPNKLGLSNTTVLLVRVLEAVGLLRETNFSLKRVTIRKPFCSLQLRNIVSKSTTKKLQKTKTEESTLFPMWDQTFFFDVHESDFMSDNSVIRLHIEGYERIRSSSLGMVDITLKSIARSCQVSKSRSFQSWFQLEKRLAPRSAVAGKIFLVFQLMEKDKINLTKVPPIYDTETKEEEEVGIFIGTLNCGNAAPPKNLEDWLRPNIQRHKIVVVGCQECDWKKEKNAEKIWLDAILWTINGSTSRDNKYITLEVCNLEEMRLFCFVDKRSLVNQKVCHVSSFTEATGIASVHGNKGATLIALDYGGTSFCFINSHLAAHQKRDSWDRRNADYKEICSNIKGIGNIKQDIMEQFHHVFWLGDLNYRCNWKQIEEPKDTPPKELFNEYSLMIARGRYNEMLEFDQLNISRRKKEAFYGFKENLITFPPTFKVYPDRPYAYQEKRTPSWCDRILWKSAPGFETGVISKIYTNAPKIRSSDHKPVYSEFSIRTWPRVPGKVDDGVKSKIVKGTISFKGCKASGLRSSDIISTSDPYLYFPEQELLELPQKSKWEKSTTNPNWRDEDLPRLNLKRTNPRFLANALLLVQCWDYDRFSAADKLASGCLSLNRLVAKLGEWVNFKCTMTFEGVEGGLLEGAFRLQLSS